MNPTRREVLKLGAITPVLPILNNTEKLFFQKCYKVCSETDIGLFSIFTQGKYRIQYKLNEWSHAKIGKIFVFDKIDSALHYIENYYSILTNPKIYQCLAKNLTRAKYMCGTRLGGIDDECIEIFWNQNFNTLAISLNGTRYCDALKPIKEIKYDKSENFQ